MTDMPDADPAFEYPDGTDTLLNPGGEPSTFIVADLNAELTATAVALRKRTSQDILTPDSFPSLAAAVAARANGAVIIPPSVTGTATPDVGTTKTVVDLRPANAHISRLGGKRHIREFSPDETGTLDSLAAFTAALAAMPNGGTLVLAPRATYSISSTISFNTRSHITVEGNGATILQRAAFSQSSPMVNLSGSSFITLEDLNLVGIATVASAGAGIALDGAALATINRCSVTSVGGSGLSIASDVNVHDIVVSEFTATSCKTHGMSFKAGRAITVDTFAITGAGTHGIDLEPTAAAASTLAFKRGEITTVGGYGVLSHATSVRFDDVRLTACASGSMSMNGASSRFNAIVADGSLSFLGADGCGSQIRCASFRVSGPRGRYDGVFIPSSAATATGAYINTDPTVVVTGLQILGSETVFAAVGTTPASFGSVSAPYQAVEPGSWKTWFPNLWKGTAYSDVWVPNGFDHHSDPVYGVRSLSGTSTKGRNLRGVGVPITGSLPANSTVTIPFPSVAARQFGSFSLTAGTRAAGGAAVTDNFDRASSAVSLGTATTGQTWQALSGTWGITNNKAYKVNTTATQDLAVIDAGLTGCDLSCDITVDATPDVGIVFGVLDAQNYLLFAANSTVGGLKLYKNDAGTFTQLATATVANYQTTTKTLRATFNSTTGLVTCYFAGVSVMTYTLTGGELAKFGVGTKQGIRSFDTTGVAVTFDNFSCAAVLTGIAPGTWYYRVGARRTLAGPTAWLAEQSVIVATGQNMVDIGLTNWMIDTIGSDYIEGVSWVRGAAPNTYTYRGDALLANAPFVSGILHGVANTVSDYGAGSYTLSTNGAVNNISVTEVGPAAVTCVDESGWEPDTAYGVQATPSWASTAYCIAKRRNGFDLRFGSDAPGPGGTVDWIIVR